MKSFSPSSDPVPQIEVPEAIASSFATVDDFEKYITDEIESRGLSEARFRHPDHLISQMSKPRMVSTDSRRNQTTCGTPTSRRSVLRKLGSIAAVASLLTLLGWSQPKSAAACGCKVRRNVCRRDNRCLQSFRLVQIEYSYTYDTLGGCDVYCGSTERSIRCGC